MNDVQIIKDALLLFVSVPDPIFRKYCEQMTEAHQALNRISEKLAVVDQVAKQLHGLIAK